MSSLGDHRASPGVQPCQNAPAFPSLSVSAHSASVRRFAYMKGLISLCLSDQNNKKIDNSQTLTSFHIGLLLYTGQV